MVADAATGPSTTAKVVNFVGFQVGWFACVLGASADLAWIGPVFATLWCVLYATTVHVGPRVALAVVGVVMLVGGGIDSLLAWNGRLVFGDDAFRIGALPLWMWSLWAVFATTLNSSLAWLQRRVALAAVFGAIGGPLAYLGGEKLGAVAIGDDRTASLLAIGVAWALVTPAAALFARRFDPRS